MEALLLTLLRGNEDATALCLTVFKWANDYDHLVDEDVSQQDRVATLHSAMGGLVAMGANPFYIKHQQVLHTTIVSCMSAWRISTTLQKSPSTRAHHIAHVLRWTPIEFFLQCARILYGEEWVQGLGPWFWVEMTKAHSFDEFARECGGN